VLANKFADHIRIMCVYIQEAHAVNTWPLGLEISFETTHTPEARAEHAKFFCEKFNFKHPTYIDVPPAQAFNTLFAAWPLRFYVFDAVADGARLSYVCQPEGDLVSVIDVYRYLTARFL
jgi:hypothetical protein